MTASPIIQAPNLGAIFNVGKKDYGAGGSMFKGQDPGLFDTIHKLHPRLKQLFKALRNMDWPEDDFKFSACNLEFKTRPYSMSERMRRTIAWQWESDSVAARTIGPVTAPFVTCPELQRFWARVTENEYLHAATYSEIVAYSFDDPGIIMADVLQVREAQERLVAVAQVMDNAFHVGTRINAGELDRNSDEAYDAIMLYVAALYALERIQFMASFAVTFAIGATGAFMPIAQAVQKICQDEFDVHAVADEYIIRHEMSLKCGQEFWERHGGTVRTMYDQVMTCEHNWIKFMDFDQDPLVGTTEATFTGFTNLMGGAAYNTWDMKPDFVVPRKNPAMFMEKWVDISKIQNSLQEQDGGAYKVNVKRETLGSTVLDIDF